MKSVYNVATHRWFYSFIFLFCLSYFSQAQTWTAIATDPTGDASNGALLDGTGFSYYYDPVADSVWFKVDVANLNTSTASAMGVNIMVNITGGGSTFNFWGTDNSNAFHKLVTVWVTGAPPSSYSGTIGVANASGVSSQNYTNLSSNNIDIEASIADKSIVLGMKRTDLVTNAELGGSPVDLGAAAAVGSNQFWNDDIYQAGGTMTIDTSTVGIANYYQQPTFETWPNPTSGIFHLQGEDLPGSEVRLFDTQGRSVSKMVTLSNTQETLDFSHLPSGLYFIHLRNQNALMTQSLVIRN